MVTSLPARDKSACPEVPARRGTAHRCGLTRASPLCSPGSRSCHSAAGQILTQTQAQGVLGSEDAQQCLAQAAHQTTDPTPQEQASSSAGE